MGTKVRADSKMEYQCDYGYAIGGGLYASSLFISQCFFQLQCGTASVCGSGLCGKFISNSFNPHGIYMEFLKIKSCIPFCFLLFTACEPPVGRVESHSDAPPQEAPTALPVPEASETDTTALPNAVDTLWADLPLLPPPEPPPQPVPEAEVTGRPPRYFPTEMKTTKDVFGETRVLPIPEAVWRAGYYNGIPSGIGGGYSPEEYPVDQDFSDAIQVRDPNEFPAFLQPGQTVVLHIPPLPADLYVFHLATTGGDPETFAASQEIYTNATHFQRFVRIRFNDEIVWQRSVAPLNAVTRVVLNPNRLLPGTNLITLENLGTHAVPLDAAWISPFRKPSQALFVGLEQAEWLNREQSAWVRNTKLHLPAAPARAFPPGAPEPPLVVDNFNVYERTAAERAKRPVPPDLPPGIRVPVHNPAELAHAWKNTLKYYRELEDLSHPHLPSLQKWMITLRDTTQRGMMTTVVMEHDDETPYSAEASAYIFGEVVQAWDPAVSEFNWEDLHVARILDRIPTARIYHRLNKFPFINKKGKLSDIPFRQGFKESLDIGIIRHGYFSGELRHYWLPENRATLPCFHYPDRQAFRSEAIAANSAWAFNSVAEWLMERQQGVFVKGGQPGGLFFPDGSDRPSPFWTYLRPMFRFGSWAHHPGIANIAASSTAANPVFLHWAVADNGKDSVHVLAHTSGGNPAGMAVLNVPVPWSGPTKLIHHSTVATQRTNAVPVQDTTFIELDAVEVTASGESGVKGWIQLEFAMRGMHVFEFYPKNRSTDTSYITAPEKIGFDRLTETKNMFSVNKEAPPSWWSRREAGSSFQTDWMKTGAVQVEPEVAATADAVPGWQPMKGFHPQQPTLIQGVAPISATSTRFQFLEPEAGKPQALRMIYPSYTTREADAVGLWIRAHRPPDYVREVDPFRPHPVARFYLGILPRRQVIEMEYDRWHFVSAPGHYWVQAFDSSQTLLFWPCETEKFQPIVEVNSCAAYQASLNQGTERPEKCLGFIQERADGTLALLVVGTPGKPAFWSQRLDRFIDASAMRHVEDPTLVVSADSPDDPPPEKVECRFSWQEEARLLEVQIPEMPPLPTESYRQRIQEEFPLIGYLLQKQPLSVVLFEEKRGKEIKGP